MKKWSKLDNAAKIFPSTVENSETRVFRIYCELKEDVCPEALQSAVEQALKQFPQFRKILRKGLFWYYMENSSQKPVVQEEFESPCSQLYRSGHHNLLFSVTYYKKRINLEIFHVLADGAGGIIFLKSILAAYLNILHPDTLPLDDPLLDNPLDISDMDTDAFEEYYTGEKDTRDKSKKLVWILRSKRRPDLDINVTEGIISTKKILELSHKYHATMTQFLVAVFIRSIIKNLSDREIRKTLVIDIPINLRNFFPSDTTRNFFAILPITYQPQSQDDSLEQICQAVVQEFADVITQENLAGKINSLGSFERIMPMRLVPLFLKDPGLRFINFLTKRFVTGCFSNLGRIVFPESMDPYIQQMGIYSSTQSIQAECCSFHDHMVIGFTEAFLDVTVIYAFFEELRAMGVDVTINTNTPAVCIDQNAHPIQQTASKEVPVSSAQTILSKESSHINSANTVDNASESSSLLSSSTDSDIASGREYVKQAKSRTDKKLVWFADPAKRTESRPDDVFPVPKDKKHLPAKLLHISNIICIIAMLCYALVYVFTQNKNFWIIIMCINTLFIWNSVVRGMIIKSSILRRLFTCFLWTSIFYLAIDIFSGWHGWSVTLQLPTFALVNLFLSLYLSALFKTDTSDEELTLYLSLESMMGIVPGVLVLTPALPFTVYTLALSIICIIFMLLMLLFRWRSIKHEYKKTFHF